MSEAKIMVVANRKGGTGKTTTVVNLAAVWAQAGKKVLVIDLDTQGHCAIGLGVRTESIRPDFTSERLLDHPELDCSNCIMETGILGLWMIPANTAYWIKPPAPQDALRKSIDVSGLREKFDIILIDTPPSLDAHLLNAMAAADGVLVPFVPHKLSAVGISQLSQLFYHIAAQYNPALKLFGIIPMMADKHVRLHRATIDELTKQYGRQRLLRPVRTNIKLAEAFAEHLPVSFYAPRSNGALDFILLAADIDAVWR